MTKSTLLGASPPEEGLRPKTIYFDISIPKYDNQATLWYTKLDNKHKYGSCGKNM